VQLRCRLDHWLLKTSRADDYSEVVEIHKLSGDHCSMLKVRAASMEHFEGLLERLGKHGQMRTSVVLSTQYEGRPVEAPTEEFARVTHSQAGASHQPAREVRRCGRAEAHRTTRPHSMIRGGSSSMVSLGVDRSSR
jgi:Lrp/AsnC family leucine-responsive transcriptional regulator